MRHGSKHFYNMNRRVKLFFQCKENETVAGSIFHYRDSREKLFFNAEWGNGSVHFNTRISSGLLSLDAMSRLITLKSSFKKDEVNRFKKEAISSPRVENKGTCGQWIYGSNNLLEKLCLLCLKKLIMWMKKKSNDASWNYTSWIAPPTLWWISCIPTSRVRTSLHSVPKSCDTILFKIDLQLVPCRSDTYQEGGKFS